MAVLGEKMLRNLVVCYLITTELKPKCPTCTQLMSFLALRKKTWERSVLSHHVLSIGNHEKNAHFHLHVALLIARNSASEVLLFCASSLSRNQSSDKLITFSILDSILDYCASILGTLCMRVSRIESRIETRKRLSTYI